MADGTETAKDADDGKMPFLAHLGELRHRILTSLIAIAVGFVITFNYSEQLIDWMARPFHNAQRQPNGPGGEPRFVLPEDVGKRVDALFPAPGFTDEQRAFLKGLTGLLADLGRDRGQRLQVIEVTEAFWVNMKVAFVAGAFLVLPVLLYEVWAFVSPGLHPHERKFALPFVILSTLFFAIGAAFALLVIVPFAVAFMAGYKTGNLLVQWTLNRYVDFVLKFTLAFGLVFELPLAITIGSRIGLITPEFLARNRKYAILINFIVAAILTPTPDAFNQVLMAAPLCLLYEAGIIAARLFGRRPVTQGA
jgi:sec-independent protein translocase protein TatC